MLVVLSHIFFTTGIQDKHSLKLCSGTEGVSAWVAFDESLLNTFKRSRSFKKENLGIICHCSCGWTFKHFGASKKNTASL